MHDKLQHGAARWEQVRKRRASGLGDTTPRPRFLEWDAIFATTIPFFCLQPLARVLHGVADDISLPDIYIRQAYKYKGACVFEYMY